MALDLPIYAIVGQKPMKMFRTPGGGMDQQTWDFDLGEFVRRGANDMDALFGREAPGGGEDALRGDVPHQGGMDVEYVSEAEFEAYVDELRKAVKASSEARPKNTQGD